MSDTLKHDAIYPFEEACPGCGCTPGDGRTPGCSHPDGCGYFTEEFVVPNVVGFDEPTTSVIICKWCDAELPPSDVDAPRVYCSKECYLSDGGQL